jgi:hypothetical protein
MPLVGFVDVIIICEWPASSVPLVSGVVASVLASMSPPTERAPRPWFPFPQRAALSAKMAINTRVRRPEIEQTVIEQFSMIGMNS